MKVHALLRSLIKNTFVLNGSKLRRQTVGIPMGTNCAPPCANLYLYSYESDFIDTLVNDGHLTIARRFQNTFRLIDDALSVDNPHFEVALANGLYPSALTLNNTTLSPTHAHFVGMSFSFGRILIDLFDKRAEFPFPVIRYPHLDSAIPHHLPYRTFIGGLARLYSMITLSHTFLSRCIELALLLHRQGCSLLRLSNCFRSFLHTRVPLRWPISSSFLCSRFRHSLSFRPS